MRKLFGKTKYIKEHIKNVLREDELIEKEVCRKFRHTSFGKFKCKD